MHRPASPRWLLLTALVLCACRGDARETTVHAPDRRVREVALGDSVPYRNELRDGVLYRVIVATSDGTDTVPGVLTAQLPVRSGDTSVVGFRYEQDRVLGTFRYTPASRTVRTDSLPGDLLTYSTPRFAPSGRRLAYIGRDSAGRGYGVVVAWPARRVLHRGPPVVLLAGDGILEGIEWREDERRFTIAIALDSPQGKRQITRGVIDDAGRVTVAVDSEPPRRPVRVQADTVRAAP